jgi:hypothetical protein
LGEYGEGIRFGDAVIFLHYFVLMVIKGIYNYLVYKPGRYLIDLTNNIKNQLKIIKFTASKTQTSDF